MVDLNTGNADGKTRTYYQEGRKGQSPKGSRPLGELVEQIRSRKDGDFIGETTLIRAAGYMAHDGRGYRGRMLDAGADSKPGVPRGDRPALGLDKTFYMPAGRRVAKAGRLPRLRQKEIARLGERLPRLGMVVRGHWGFTSVSAFFLGLITEECLYGKNQHAQPNRGRE